MKNDKITLNKVENFLRRKFSQDRYDELKEAGWPVDDKNECLRLLHAFDRAEHVADGGLFLADTLRIKHGEGQSFAHTKNHCAVVRRVSPPLVFEHGDQEGMDEGQIRLFINDHGVFYTTEKSGTFEDARDVIRDSWKSQMLAGPRGVWFDDYDLAKAKAIEMLRERRPGEAVTIK